MTREKQVDMKTMVVPVDFTAASLNALDFAGEWAKKYLYERIILLRSFYSTMYENMIISADFSNMNAEYLNDKRTRENQKLEDLYSKLSVKTGKEISIQTSCSELPLRRSLLQLIKSEKPELVVIGSDSANANNEAFVSGNVIAIGRLSPVRVLMVPRKSRYAPISKALVPVDFKMVHSLNKFKSLYASPRWHDVELIALNVDSQQKSLRPDKNFMDSEKSLHQYLKNFKHRIFYETDKNIISGILNSPKLKEAQLVIALPGAHSFLYSLTHKSVSEALYRNCPLPVMILK